MKKSLNDGGEFLADIQASLAGRFLDQGVLDRLISDRYVQNSATIVTLGKKVMVMIEYTNQNLGLIVIFSVDVMTSKVLANISAILPNGQRMVFVHPTELLAADSFFLTNMLSAAYNTLREGNSIQN